MFPSEAEIPTYKCLLIGDPGTGKTAFVKRHIGEQFEAKYVPTKGANVYAVEFYTTRGSLRFNVWDTAGKDENRGLADGYYIKADCAIIMYDLTKPATQRNLRMWHRELTRVCPDIPIILCGNKSDRLFGSIHRDRSLHRKKSIRYCEISTKTKDQFAQPFLWLCRSVFRSAKLHFKEMPELVAIPLVTTNFNAATDMPRAGENHFERPFEWARRHFSDQSQQTDAEPNSSPEKSNKKADFQTILNIWRKMEKKASH